MILRRLFGRKPSVDPVADTNALTLRAMQRDWKCSCCGEQFYGITVERRLSQPATLAVIEAARDSLFAATG